MSDTESFCIHCGAQAYPPEKVVPLGDDEDLTLVSVPQPGGRPRPFVSTRTAVTILALLLVTAGVSFLLAQLWRENESLRAQLSAKTDSANVAAQTPQPTPLQTHTDQIVNNFFSVPAAQRTWIPFEVPVGVRNGRIVGGFREQYGYPVTVSITDADSKEVVYQYEPRTSSKINQELAAGSYRLEFENMAVDDATVAAEFYVKYEQP